MSELNMITADENLISDLSFWKALVNDLRRDYKELQVTSKEIETQLEQMLDDATDEAERAQSDLNDIKDENRKISKAHEKALYDLK